MYVRLAETICHAWSVDIENETSIVFTVQPRLSGLTGTGRNSPDNRGSG